MSHIRFLRFSHVHLFRFLPGVLGTAGTIRLSRRARFGVVIADERVRFWFRVIDGDVSKVLSSTCLGELAIRRCCGRRRLALFGTGNGKSALSLTGDVDWIRCVGGGVDGDIWGKGGIAILFFFRTTGGRGGLATNESFDDDFGTGA